MFAINPISTNFQALPKVSCAKFAEQKAEKFLAPVQKTTEKVVKELSSENIKEAVLSKYSQTANTALCVTKQAPQVYKTTSQKLAEQKGARLFQEI